MALVDKGAALFVSDADAPQTLLSLAIDTVRDDEKLRMLSQNILKLGLKQSAETIARQAMAQALPK